MSRLSLAVAVLVLLAVGAVTAVGAVDLASQESTTPVVPTTPGEPNHLAINASEVGAANTTAAAFDVGTAISADSGSIRAEYARHWFDAAYANASTDQARLQVVEELADQLGGRIADLEDRNRETAAAYARGSISATQFLRERARIQSRADQLQQTSADVVASVPQRFEDPVVHVNGRLIALQGPISGDIANDIVRSGDGERVYVEVSDSGYTLAHIADGEYTRETYLDAARYPEQPEQLANGSGGLNAARNRVLDFYPWIEDNQESPLSVRGYQRGIYQVNQGFPGGEIRVLLSGGTTNVYREHQTRILPSFNTTEVINRTRGDAQIAIERTYETGPASITMRDATTGDPIDGTVEIGGRDSVSVGGDGTYWFVEPRGEVTVNATAAGTDVSVTFSSPAEPPTAPSRTTPGSEG